MLTVITRLGYYGITITLGHGMRLMMPYHLSLI